MTFLGHDGMMHRVAQLATLGNCCTGMLALGIYLYVAGGVIVRINTPLACGKANQDDPGNENMALALVHG